MSAIRVMVVEDSPVTSELLTTAIEADPRLELAGAFGSAEDALAALDSLAPTVISMDLVLPGMSGIEATRRIMASSPLPIVVVSAHASSRDQTLAMEALRAGALTVVEKPTAESPLSLEQQGQRICTQLAIMATVNLVRHRFPRMPADSWSGDGARSAPTERSNGALAIAASTGGPRALAAVLGALPPALALPILLVQHISPAFHDGFVRWLDSLSALAVASARDGEALVAGRVYVAPPDRHLELSGARLRLHQGPAVCSQRPSATVLLRSVAASAGAAGIGVVLTGMGEDGAAGLLEIRQAGGQTVAEDATTAAVHGMPGAAIRRGAAQHVLPLPEIAAWIARAALLHAPPTRGARA